ncbi:MAG: CoA transferase [Chloroflexota bacterium]|nr:CoA transferase [Chloroflexota bacterium]
MGPLEGTRVVELSAGIAGPVAGMLLGDYGAEVVKVEPPAGDPARALAGFAVWNRNKLSVVVDPHSQRGRRRLAELLAGADVCIYGDRSPVEAASPNPGLVRLRMPPYLPDGAPWAGGAESAALLSAVAGLSSRQSSFDGGPVDLVYPFPLYIQGVWAAACAVAALVERRRSGAGQTATVAGIHGVLACSPGLFVIDPARPPPPTDVGPGGRNPTYTTYRCKDGAWLFLAALTPKFQANAFRVLGVGDLLADSRIDGVPNRLIRPENRGWVRELLARAFASRPRDEWLALLELGDCPAGPLCDRDDWLDHPQVAANDLRVEVDDPERGRVVMPGLSIGLAETPGEVRAAAPRRGEHDATAGCWAPRTIVTPPMRESEGVGRDEPGRAGRGPLAGVCVLDLGTILAGPYAGSLLARLGADVVKVEAPAGDAFRETGFVYNRGMRGLAIDLRSAAGQHAFHRLVRTADVVIDNARLGVSKRLRVDYPTLADINPGIITLSIAGFGEQGPFAPKPAFDPVLQAMSGMMTAQGGDGDPAFYAIPVNDVAAAATSVLAVCLALYHRGRSGEGQRATTSLVASSLMMQSGELVRFEGRPPAPRGGRDFPGPSPADRFYRTADGWLRVQAPSLAALAEALGLAFIHRDDPAEVANALATMPSERALEQLSGARIPTAPARQPADVAPDPAIAPAELLAERRFPDGKPYLVPHRYARFSRTEQAPVADPPGVGEHSREVLAEAGLSAAEIEALIEQGIVIQGSPFVLKELVNYR